MGSIKYIDYQAQPILFLDFEGVASDHEIIELGEKAQRLVKLGSRNKILMLYNLKDMDFTRRVMVNLNRLMANADMVERRVVFGVDPKYQYFLEKLIQLLRIGRNTKVCLTYTEAVNTLSDEAQWLPERRRVTQPVPVDNRKPVRVYTEEDFLDMGIGEGRLIQLPDFGPKDR